MAEHPFFPLFVDLSGRRVLIVGAGRIAARRAAALVDFGPDIRVVAPELCPEIAALAEAGRLAAERRGYRESDLDGAALALACTDDAALNAGIARACRARGIPVNVCSDSGLCDFLFPGVARRDGLVVGVTASGRDHAAAKRLTGAVRKLLEEE